MPVDLKKMKAATDKTADNECYCPKCGSCNLGHDGKGAAECPFCGWKGKKTDCKVNAGAGE